MALLTVRAAAAQLGVAYSTLKRWVHTGQVRTTRTEGGHHRVSDSEIERLLTRQQPESKRRAAPATSTESIEGLSARNRLSGFVEEVRIDGLLAQVRLRVGDQSLTAVITADAVRAFLAGNLDYLALGPFLAPHPRLAEFTRQRRKVQVCASIS